MATEKRLIWDTDAQHRFVALAVKRGNDSIPMDMITHILFNESPTVDAVEVVHGRWIQGESVLDKDGGGSIYHCSECGDWYHNFVPNYCPNCGAKMDGGADNGL